MAVTQLSQLAWEQPLANARPCIIEAIREAGDVAALEWRDPIGLSGCSSFTVRDSRIAFQRGCWEELHF
ncbi:hypothetical protein CBM2609_U20002 [Cupriavidus taiwanensis]|nr:hypothetical protein CBM2604_U20002 [Cupriavidus taiwanensis]SOZ34502.1 hypothetical protein CBM2609_U20002 [Cupriavidus taiwanensis]SOZ53151.1 hypothetical protein CBM2610_U30011 [Cupriavidus taiwanensis]